VQSQAVVGAGEGWCTLTHRHKINTFFSLHRRPGDNHEIMWPARSERTPPKCVAAVAVCYNPPSTRKTIPARCHLLCVAQLSEASTRARFRSTVYRIDRREIADYADLSSGVIRGRD